MSERHFSLTGGAFPAFEHMTKGEVFDGWTYVENCVNDDSIRAIPLLLLSQSERASDRLVEVLASVDSSLSMVDADELQLPTPQELYVLLTNVETTDKCHTIMTTRLRRVGLNQEIAALESLVGGFHAALSAGSFSASKELPKVQKKLRRLRGNLEKNMRSDPTAVIPLSIDDEILFREARTEELNLEIQSLEASVKYMMEINTRGHNTVLLHPKEKRKARKAIDRCRSKITFCKEQLKHFSPAVSLSAAERAGQKESLASMLDGNKAVVPREMQLSFAKLLREAHRNAEHIQSNLPKELDCFARGCRGKARALMCAADDISRAITPEVCCSPRPLFSRLVFNFNVPCASRLIPSPHALCMEKLQTFAIWLVNKSSSPYKRNPPR
jgi:hypothetical protein